MADIPAPKRRRSSAEDYVDNKLFSEEIEKYARYVQKALEEEKDYDAPSNYIGECFLKIANGLSRAPNFSGYSFKEDMVMDAVENFVKAVENYDITTATRTGAPNAFSYFTKIGYYAFLRRIMKENKQTEIKVALIENGNLDSFAEFDESASGFSIMEKVRTNGAKHFTKDGFGDQHTNARKEKFKERFKKARDKNKKATKKPESDSSSFDLFN